MVNGEDKGICYCASVHITVAKWCPQETF